VAHPARTSDTADDAYAIRVSIENKDIYASFKQANDNPLDSDSLRHIIRDSGYSNAFIDEESVHSLVDAYNEKRVDVRLKVGELRDAYCRVFVSVDQQKAFLSTNLACGGRQLNRADIFKAIVNAGICRGILNQCINYALQHGRVDRILIARGALPIHGKDSEFKPLISNYRDRRPRIDENGRAHYQDIGKLVTVAKGEALMRRLPPSQGIDGFDVLGNQLTAREGMLIPFSDELSGVEIDNEDPDLLRASVNGQPLFLNHGAIVEKTIRIENVDLSSGNIDFDGSIAISGNVATGMSVTASGDVYIDGMVEAAATICAGGDIIVLQGIIGRGMISDDKGEAGKGTTIIKAAGNIKARFIEHANVNAGRSIAVEELLAHSIAYAGDEIRVGNDDSKNGHIRGGTVCAATAIYAQVLGSPSGVATRFMCADISELQAQLKLAQQNLEEYRQRRRILEQNLARQCVAATASNDQAASRRVIQRTQSQLDEVDQEINQLHCESNQIKQHIEINRGQRIYCRKKAYSNIEISIADASLKLNEEKSFGHFYFQESQIHFKV